MMSDFLREHLRHSLTYLDYLHKHSPLGPQLGGTTHWANTWLDGFMPAVTYPAGAIAMLAAAGDGTMSVGEQLAFILTGLVVVFVTLSVLALWCGAAGLVFQGIGRRAAAAPPAAAPIAPDERIPAEVVAVITAAVAATVGEHYGVVDIRALTPEQMASSHEGVSHRHPSHNVGRK